MKNSQTYKKGSVRCVSTIAFTLIVIFVAGFLDIIYSSPTRMSLIGETHSLQDDQKTKNVEKASSAILQMEQAIDKVLNKRKMKRSKAVEILGEASNKLDKTYDEIGLQDADKIPCFHCANHLGMYSHNRVNDMKQNSRLSKETRNLLRADKSKLSLYRMIVIGKSPNEFCQNAQCK